MAEQSLLNIVTEFCRRKSLPIPTTVVGAQDDLTLQIWGLMNEGIQEIASRYNHQQLQTKLTFTHAGGADYLAWDFGAQTPDWKFLIPKTLWNATGRLQVRGPLTPREWQQLTVMTVAQALYSHILFGNAIHIFGVPNPLGSVSFTCYYQSKYGVYDGVSAFTESYTSDASSPRLPSALILADIKWRLAREKGLPYAEDQRTSESMLVNAVGSNDQGDLIMDGADYGADFSPGVIVPSGSWLQP